MIATLFIRLLITGASFAVAAAILSGMEVSGGFGALLWISVVFGLVNAIIGTVLHVLTFPLTLLTLGLFAIVVNAALLKITDSLTSHLTIDEFWWTAIWATLIISIVSVVLDGIIVRFRNGRREAAR
jgi:putative membrane protein